MKGIVKFGGVDLRNPAKSIASSFRQKLVNTWSTAILAERSEAPQFAYQKVLYLLLAGNLNAKY
jgi:hypothetical protein